MCMEEGVWGGGGGGGGGKGWGGRGWVPQCYYFGIGYYYDLNSDVRCVNGHGTKLHVLIDVCVLFCGLEY